MKRQEVKQYLQAKRPMNMDKTNLMCLKYKCIYTKDPMIEMIANEELK